MSGTLTKIPEAVLERWSRLPGSIESRVGTGLINDTFMVTDERSRTVIVQRLHPVFSAEINRDIAAVTRRLAEFDIETPELIPTDDGALWVEHEGRIWRAQSYVPGNCYDRIDKPAFAEGAGKIAARFHSALAGFVHDYCFSRTGVHDTPAHIAALATAIDAHPGHLLAADVIKTGTQVLAAAAGIPDFSRLPLRHTHGDLKISNILFDEAGQGVCLIDLDTLAKMPWPFEMGDALRSWCNPVPEDDPGSFLDLGLFEAALSGYAANRPAFLTAPEIDALLPGLRTITLELTARFLTDTLNDQYFGWDATRYASRAEHNLARAHGMWHLYRDMVVKRDKMSALITRYLGA